jgi:translation elongation factor P/translation initiation factor 5A
MKIEDIYVCNLKTGNYIETQEGHLGTILDVSPPRKAGKHGSAKVIYTYKNLKSGDKKKIIAKSRDEVKVYGFNKNTGSILNNEEGELLIINQKTEESILIPSENRVDLTIIPDEGKLHYFLFNDNYYLSSF